MTRSLDLVLSIYDPGKLGGLENAATSFARKDAKEQQRTLRDAK
jgi:hypothetical protein